MRHLPPLQVCRIHGVTYRGWKADAGCRECRRHPEDAFIDQDLLDLDRLDRSIEVLRSGFARSRVKPPSLDT